MSNQSDRVKQVLAGIRARVGKGAAGLFSDGTASDVEEVIPTGIDVIDHYILGIGGWPVGRIVELYSEEGGGKTSLLMQTMAGVQREGGVAVLFETEHAIDAPRAAVFGCDLNQAIIGQPETMEDALVAIQAALESMPTSKKGDPPNFVGWDSLASAPTKAEIEEGPDSPAAMGARARAMSVAMRVLTPLASEKRCLLMIINQTRTKLGMVFGDPTTTPGGAALKFHASIRLRLMGGKAVKNGEDHTGKVITVSMQKTKVGGTPFAKARVLLDYKTGFRNEWTTVNYAKDRKLIPDKTRPTAGGYAEALTALGWKPGWATTSGSVGSVLDLTSIGGGDDGEADED